MHGNGGANQLCRDLRLEIRKGKDEVWLEGENFWNVGRSEGRNARLLPPDSGRPHGIAGHIDNAVLLTWALLMTICNNGDNNPYYA
jgi:hypothetical protein